MDRMTHKHYKALVVHQTDYGYQSAIEQNSTENLPKGSLLVRVHYSSLNYKDALSMDGNRGVTKMYPHTPGIDACGEVAVSDSPLFHPGERVIVTGNDLGMNTPGGFGEYIRVPADWAVKLPVGLSMKEAMMYGTAGFTAGLSVLRLSGQVGPNQGRVMVTGATGGVGSMSVAILCKLGYHVTALTRQDSERGFLAGLGVEEMVTSEEFMDGEHKALLPSKYCGGIDTVGGDILAQLLRQVSLQGVVTCCGNIVSADLQTSIYPFILRAVSLIGISSQHCFLKEKQEVWARLANEWKPADLRSMCQEIGLEEVPYYAKRMLDGGLKGRKVIKIS